MNRSEFIEYWATTNNVSKSEARKAVDTYEKTYKAALHEYRKLNLKDFINAEIKDKSEIKGINRKTKEAVDIPARQEVSLSIAKSFKYMEENYLV